MSVSSRQLTTVVGEFSDFEPVLSRTECRAMLRLVIMFNVSALQLPPLLFGMLAYKCLPAKHKV